MKLNPFLAIAVVAILSLSACKKEKAETSETAVSQTEIEHDSAVLSDDSATVETASDVKDEEQNAIQQEQKDAEKLKDAEQK